MFCALLGQDISLALTGPLILWHIAYRVAIMCLEYKALSVTKEWPEYENQDFGMATRQRVDSKVLSQNWVQKS